LNIVLKNNLYELSNIISEVEKFFGILIQSLNRWRKYYVFRARYK